MNKLLFTLLLINSISINVFSQTKNVNQFGNNNTQNITISPNSTVNINTKVVLSNDNIDSIVVDIRREIKQNNCKKDTIGISLTNGGNSDIYSQLLEDLPKRGLYIESTGQSFTTKPIKGLQANIDKETNTLRVLVGS